MIIAKDERWTYTYNEGIDCIMYTEDGKEEKVWCGRSDLRRHLRHLKNVIYGKNWDSMIPDYWECVNYEFLKNLGIY